jgi:hypothetical protein
VGHAIAPTGCWGLEPPYPPPPHPTLGNVGTCEGACLPMFALGVRLVAASGNLERTLLARNTHPNPVWVCKHNLALGWALLNSN